MFQTQLIFNFFPIGADGFDTQVQIVWYLFCGFALADELKNLQLTIGQYGLGAGIRGDLSCI